MHTCLLPGQVLLCVCAVQFASLRARLSTDSPSASVLQVKLAGPRPGTETQPRTSCCTGLHPDFGRGHRLFVGGIADAVTKESVQQHFAKWGDVSDVYFPAARGLSKSTYCFVTFGSHDSAQQAYWQSQRSIDGWVRNFCTAAGRSCSAM